MKTSHGPPGTAWIECSRWPRINGSSIDTSARLPALRLARREGWPTRIGLEDTLYLPDGTPAESNAQLVRTALALV